MSQREVIGDRSFDNARFVPLHGISCPFLAEYRLRTRTPRSLPFALPSAILFCCSAEKGRRRTDKRARYGVVGHREILYPRRKWWRQTGNGLTWKRKRREENLLVVPFAVCHLRPRFSRATLVRVSYYLTLPYGFPLNRERCSLNFIKAVSPSFESCQCGIVESHSSSAVLPSPGSIARVFRVPRNLPSVSLTDVFKYNRRLYCPLLFFSSLLSV